MRSEGCTRGIEPGRAGVGEGEGLWIYGDECQRDGEYRGDFCPYVILFRHGGVDGQALDDAGHIPSIPGAADLPSHCPPGCGGPSSPCLGRRSQPRIRPRSTLNVAHSAAHPAGGKGRQRGVCATAGANHQTRRVLGAVQVLVTSHVGGVASIRVPGLLTGALQHSRGGGVWEGATLDFGHGGREGTGMGTVMERRKWSPSLAKGTEAA